jgi:hypothetical protein
MKLKNFIMLKGVYNHEKVSDMPSALYPIYAFEKETLQIKLHAFGRVFNGWKKCYSLPTL